MTYMLQATFNGKYTYKSSKNNVNQKKCNIYLTVTLTTNRDPSWSAGTFQNNPHVKKQPANVRA